MPHIYMGQNGTDLWGIMGLWGRRIMRQFSGKQEVRTHAACEAPAKLVHIAFVIVI